MRREIADLINGVLPMPPVSGPPLPEVFKIRWPARMSYKIMPRVVHQVDNVYLRARTKLSSTIRGF